MIEELPRIESGARHDIMSLETETLDKIERTVKKMKLEFEQFEKSFISEKEARLNKLKDLKTTYTNLKAQVYDFLEIFPN